MLKLSIIEDVFELFGRGVVAIPGIPLPSDRVVKAGDARLLKRPDGSELTTRVRGVEMIDPALVNRAPEEGLGPLGGNPG